MQYDTDEELSPSLKVIRAVADARGCEPTALEPLTEAVDPDALNVLASGQSSKTECLHVSFEYEGYLIRLEHDRQLTVVVEDSIAQ